MKTPRIVILALLLSGIAGAALAQTSVSAGIHIGPSGRASVDIGFFYDDLASYGNWIERPSYGWVWAPRAVATTWRPYQAGHWVWTDLGWTWVSDEPYGWATYHYGRWYDDPELGWVWVPGDEWGPAWVSWQEGSDYIGWAPLPPSVNLSFGDVLSVSLAPETYVFVPERYFLAPRITTYIVPRERVVNVYRETRNITVYRQVNNYVYNTGVPVDRIQRVVGRPVPRYQVADARSARVARVQGNQVTIFRPQVQKANVPPPPQRPAARRAVVDAQQFQRSHPNRPGRGAQETSGAAVQPAPAPRAGRQRTVQPSQTEQTQPTEQPRPRNRGKAQQEPEMTPPGRHRQVQPPPGQTERQRPPRQQPPPGQEKRQERQRPPQETPPPQRPPRQVQPERQPPPPQQQQEKRQRQQENKKEKQQEEHKPPHR